MANSFKVLSFFFVLSVSSWGQVDTTYIYNPETPYGGLDVRIAKSPTRYYFLEEGVTFSFRETSPGVKSNTFADMTAWDSSPYTEGNLREQIEDESAFVMNYRLLKPNNHNSEYEPGYPLLVLLHGSGETANCWNSNCFHADQNYSPVINDPPAPTDPEHELLNNDHSLLHGGKVYLDAVNRAGDKLPDDNLLDATAFPGFVLFPQNLNGWYPNTVQDAIRIIRLLCKKYNIDQDRIYIHGISNGGYGVYEALKRTPWMFASAIAMSAVSDGFITNASVEESISNIKLWIFQGSLDTNPLPQKTRKYVDRFRLAGVEVRYTEYPDVGHTVWNRAYKEPDFFSWFLGHRQSVIHAFGGVPVICSPDGLKLELPEGFFAYQWQKDGAIIDGANSSEYMATEPGNYRARFSRTATPQEGDWNEWSPEVQVTRQDPPAASIRQEGTVVLRDLNNLNEARLEADQDYARYYWYKDGSLMNLPGTQDDTLKSIVIKPGNCEPACIGNGEYSLVTLDYNNCYSQVSESKFVFLNDQAPINIQSPAAFQASSATASAINLQWSDYSDNEIGFEIWRRLKTGENQFSPWEMVTLTTANAQSFNDETVQPFQTYQYKLRAVGSNGRSVYVPEEGALEAATSADVTPPSVPTNVTSKRTGLERILLTWSPADDDTGIDHYLISSEFGETQTISADTFLVIDSMVIDTLYHFTVRAADFGGNVSDSSESVTVATNVSGLFYEHSPGSWPSLDSIDWTMPEYTGWINNFSMTPKTQDDYFYLKFDGFIYIESAGDYKFRISSDDGSRLLLNNSEIADNDGIHEMVGVESSLLPLAQGPSRITVEFFEYQNSDSLAVEYNGPDTDNEWRLIPAEALRSKMIISVEEEIQSSFVVDVYPNPGNQHEIQVKVQSQNASPLGVTLLDPLGRPIFERSYSVSELRGGMRLSTNRKLDEGMYLLKVRQGNEFQVRKVVITNQ